MHGPGDDARPAPPPATESGRRRFALLLTVAYLLVLATLAAMHAPWRDEMQAWVIVRDSHSFAALRDALRYEGHPLLWYLLLWPLARLTPDPVAMQALHTVIAAGVIYVVARWSPFERWLVVLLALGYFFLFEFALPSRAYGLGALLLFAACALYPRRRESYLLLAVPLALLANTSAYGVIVAFAFAVALFVDWLVRRESRRAARARLGHTVAAVALLGAGGIAGAIQVQPPRDAPFQGAPVERVEAVSPYALGTTGGLVWASYAPLAQGGLEPVWGSNVLLDRGRAPLALALVLSVTLAFVGTLLVARDPPALALYLVGTGVILGVAYFLFVGSTRHFGHLWFIALAAFWLAWRAAPAQPWSPRGTLGQLAAIVHRHRALVLAALLVAQAVAGLQFVQLVLRRPVSGVPAASELVRRAARPAEVVAVAPAFLAAGASAALRRPIYMLELRRDGSFTPWREYRPPQELSADSVLRMVRPLLRERSSAIAMVNVALPSRWEELEVETLGDFTDALDPQERVHVYRVSHPASDAAADGRN